MTDHLPECMTPDDPCADPESCDSLACARQRLHLTLRDEADQREGGHLPECRYYPQQSIVGDVGCICKALRACEQRVRGEIKVFAETEWCKGHVVGERQGYAAGVQAARDAVAALEPLLNKGKREGGYDCCGCSTPNDLYDDALAAIDALKGES